MYYKLAQLILTPSQKTGTIGEVYVAQPDSNHEKIAGRLFIVIEMPASTPGGIKFINFLINDFTHNYYQNEKLILRERLSTVKIEHIFEAALAKTNKNIADFLHTPSISLNLKTLSATVGVIFESELHFAIIGHNKAFLVYPNPKSETGKDYRITEITQRLNSDEPPPSTSHTKMFSNVINGQIPPSGYFMFCNETLPEYLSNKQLTEIVTTLSPAAAIEQMKNLLGQVNAYVSFFALLIKNTLGQAVPTDRPVVTTIIPQSSQASINQLKSTESTTEHYLAPSGTVDIRSWFAKIISFWPSLNLRRGEAPTGTGQMMMTERVTFRKQTAFRWLHRLGKILHSLVEKFLTLLFLLPRLFRPGLWRVGFGRVATALVEFPKKLIALKRSHQIAIVIGIISIALLSYNLVNQNSKNQVKAKELLWQTLSQSIEQKENQADANLLYGNDFGTNQLLVEIKPLLDQLPAGDARFTTLFNRYNEQAAKARHETRIAATQLTDWNQLAAGSAKPTRLYYYKNNIYGLDGAQKSIYQYDITGKTNSRITLD
ncbi:MAG: hypothetical protein WCK11_05915, partial [Candidatus Falkowbacteria bacterium]